MDDRQTDQTYTGQPAATGSASLRPHQEDNNTWLMWLLAALAVVAIAMGLFFAFGGDAAVDVDSGDVDVEAPDADVDVDAPDVDLEAPDVDVDPGSVDVDDADAEADVDGETDG